MINIVSKNKLHHINTSNKQELSAYHRGAILSQICRDRVLYSYLLIKSASLIFVPWIRDESRQRNMSGKLNIEEISKLDLCCELFCGCENYNTALRVQGDAAEHLLGRQTPHPHKSTPIFPNLVTYSISPSTQKINGSQECLYHW